MYYVNKITKVTMYTRPPELDLARTLTSGRPQLPSRTDSSPAAMSAIGTDPNSTGSTTVPTAPLSSGSYTTVSAKEIILEKSGLKVGAVFCLISAAAHFSVCLYYPLFRDPSLMFGYMS